MIAYVGLTLFTPKTWTSRDEIRMHCVRPWIIPQTAREGDERRCPSRCITPNTQAEGSNRSLITIQRRLFATCAAVLPYSKNFSGEKKKYRKTHHLALLRTPFIRSQPSQQRSQHQNRSLAPRPCRTKAHRKVHPRRRFPQTRSHQLPSGYFILIYV